MLIAPQMIVLIAPKMIVSIALETIVLMLTVPEMLA